MKHLTLNDINPDNWHLLDTSDKSYNPERNYQVIRDVIAENDKMQLELNPKVIANAGDRADILASFAKYKLDRDGGKKLEEWLGKGWMSRIYGEKLIEKIRMAELVKKKNLQNGNTLYGGNFYLA